MLGHADCFEDPQTDVELLSEDETRRLGGVCLDDEAVHQCEQDVDLFLCQPQAFEHVSVDLI